MWSVPQEVLQQATTNYKEMLRLAESCFKSALIAGMSADADCDIVTEKWLLHYMLGKIAEKLHEAPQVYLDHYQQVRNKQTSVDKDFSMYCISALLIVCVDHQSIHCHSWSRNWYRIWNQTGRWEGRNVLELHK